MGQARDLREVEIGVQADIVVGAEIPGLSNEMVEKLSSARPETLGAASRIRGITPAALSAILLHARKAVA